MRILFIHQNFPGQFIHLAPALQKRGHQVVGLAPSTNQRPSPVPTVKYAWSPKSYDQRTLRLATTYAEMADRGERVAEACGELKARAKFQPDVIFGHFGWGETLFVKEIWPSVPLLTYGEFFYNSRGLDTDFDPEFALTSTAQRIWVTSRQAHLLHALHSADKILVPTQFQASTFPAYLRERITVVHDGIDTQTVCPAPGTTVQIPGTELRFTDGDEIITFINRNLEPYRGYHIFMRALPAILKARPKARAVLIGEDGVSYGTRPTGSKTWKETFLDEVRDKLDLSRVHFLGHVPHSVFVDLMRITRAHAYLTYPFVLSWSLLEALSAGALVIGSKTAPVKEVITHGENGLLVDFFDVKSWSAAIIEALDNPERYADLRTAARRSVVENYDLQSKCLPRHIAFVEDAARKR